MRNGLHGDFDRGYFSAWADCMRIITRMDSSKRHKTVTSKASAVEEKIETVRTDKSQATIANFLAKTEEAEKKKNKFLILIVLNVLIIV